MVDNLLARVLVIGTILVALLSTWGVHAPRAVGRSSANEKKAFATMEQLVSLVLDRGLAREHSGTCHADPRSLGSFGEICFARAEELSRVELGSDAWGRGIRVLERDGLLSLRSVGADGRPRTTDDVVCYIHIGEACWGEVTTEE